MPEIQEPKLERVAIIYKVADLGLYIISTEDGQKTLRGSDYIYGIDQMLESIKPVEKVDENVGE